VRKGGGFKRGRGIRSKGGERLEDLKDGEGGGSLLLIE
jgi:hypothetical protein